MDLSGVIFVVLALAWAIYLIPKALKHHDEVARSRSIDRFSTAMRVLARRSSSETPRPARPVGRSEPTAARPDPAPAAVRPGQRRAAVVAARRRRRVLGLLLLVDVTVAALAYLGQLPWWGEAVAVLLTALWLVVCRTQVRAASYAAFEPTADERPAAPVAGSAVYPPARRLNAQGFEEVDESEDTVALDAALVSSAVAAPGAPAEGDGSLWDPLPVTLPTYVTKPRAHRSVRTIDLGAPDTWSSGRDEADSALVAESEAAQATESGQDESLSEQRAVGS